MMVSSHRGIILVWCKEAFELELRTSFEFALVVDSLQPTKTFALGADAFVHTFVESNEAA